MKKAITLILLSTFFNITAQIGGGWDWAFNTGALGGANIKHMKYTADGSEILFGGDALAAVYFGSTTLTAPPISANVPGNIKFFGTINSATGTPTIIKSFVNLLTTFDCITTDDNGNFYTAGGLYSDNVVDFGNGVTASGTSQIVIAKFDSTGNALWAKTFPIGVIGAVRKEVSKLAVSATGNVFFWAVNKNTDTNGKINVPLYKLDSNGNLLWFKDALNSMGPLKGESTDQFIDNNENIHLLASNSTGFTFDGVLYTGVNTSAGASTIISLDGSGNILKAQTFDGSTYEYQVNRTTGNITFGWAQSFANAAPFDNLPKTRLALGAQFANSFNGIIETDKNLNFIRARDIGSTINNPFNIQNNGLRFLALPNGKLLYTIPFVKKGSYSAGTDYVYPANATKDAIAIVETDANWNLSKFITGGLSITSTTFTATAYNDTYALSAFFSADNGTSLPTTSYGSVTLTGFNAAADLTTAYGIYSSAAAYRKDVAIVQTKSSNFPKIASTTWLGNSTDWNDILNWSNGTPTSAIKAVFAQPTTNYPTISSSPTAASLEIAFGVSLALPSTLALSGGIKNEGAITLKDVGYFSGFGAKEWKGNGSMNFTGTDAILLYSNAFENALILNTNLTTYNDLNIPSLTFNSGKFNMNGKKVSITNPSPVSIAGTSETSYLYGGTLERAVNSTGVYEFPVGKSTAFQSTTITANNLVGVTKIATTFTAGAITGTTPNTTSGGATITSALNSGWYTLVPNAQPSSGNYDVTLALKGSSNSVVAPEKYTIIKRDNSTSTWTVPGSGTLATSVSGTITAKNMGLTTFSDFAIGIGSQNITLGNDTFYNNSKVTIFPNPTSNFVTITSTENIKSILVFDFLGKQLSLTISNTTVEMKNLPSGIYFLKIELENGQVQIQKIIKQ